MWIKDFLTGNVREYGTSCHDSLVKSEDGKCLYYYNLQCGEGSEFGDYRFCDENGTIPGENEDLLEHGAEDFVNIGGFEKWIPTKAAVPDNDRMVLATQETEDGRKSVVCAFFYDGTWRGHWPGRADTKSILAWMELPKVYEEPADIIEILKKAGEE